jgi:hypothetical protein
MGAICAGNPPSMLERPEGHKRCLCRPFHTMEVMIRGQRLRDCSEFVIRSCLIPDRLFRTWGARVSDFAGSRGALLGRPLIACWARRRISSNRHSSVNQVRLITLRMASSVAYGSTFPEVAAEPLMVIPYQVRGFPLIVMSTEALVRREPRQFLNSAEELARAQSILSDMLKRVVRLMESPQSFGKNIPVKRFLWGFQLALLHNSKLENNLPFLCGGSKHFAFVDLMKDLEERAMKRMINLRGSRLSDERYDHL